MSSAKKWPGKVREHPRMSAPKLGEYLDVWNAHRRQRILHDQKYPATFMVARYADAQNIIRASLLARDVATALEAGTKGLAARACVGKYREDAKRNCLDAVRAFEALLPTLPLKDVEFLAPMGSFTTRIEGVELTAHPTVLLRRELTDGRVDWGALQLVFTQDAALEKNGGQAVAEILRRALVRAGHDVDPKLCIVADVFAELYHAPPTRSLRLAQQIASACREIAILWPSIMPRRSGVA